MARCVVCREFSGRASAILAHVTAGVCQRKADPWVKVAELREAGEDDKAVKTVKRILGVHEPMPEKNREYLRRYRLEHKDEIAAKQKAKRELRKAMKRQMQAVVRKQR